MNDVQISRFWRVMTHPIYVFPGRRGARVTVEGHKSRVTSRQVIEQSGLPDDGARVVREVVRRTGLWEREKAEVAIELIAHFKDGLEAGKSIEELIASFGDVKTAAKLMRRAKKRNRPLWWRARLRMLQAMGAVLIIYLVADLFLLMRHPNPSVDYVAELNAPILALPKADEAWPIYREAWKNAPQWPLKDDALYIQNDNGWQGRELHPGDVDWPKAAAFLEAQKPLLDSLREAGIKPYLGYSLTYEMTPQESAVFNHPGEAPAAPHAQSRLPRLNQVLLPYISAMRQSAFLLAADMRAAADKGDTSRILGDYRAIVGMARQCREVPFTVSQIISAALVSHGDQALMDINLRTPNSLAKCRIELLHTMASVDPVFDLDLNTEHDFTLDMIQHVYSDNGHGDGTLTLDGLKVMQEIPSNGQGYEENNPRIILGSLGLPAAAMLGSRKEITEQDDRYFAAVRDDNARPLWIKLRAPSKATALIFSWRNSTFSNARFALLTVIMPGLNRIGITIDQYRAAHEATMIALALEAYREKNERYPTTLVDLAPLYFPKSPIDYSTGGLLKYKLTDGKPVLYGLGKDNVDDGGVWTDKKTHWPDVPEKGDWVLYPKPEE